MLTSTESGSLAIIANRLGVSYNDLYDLIYFESNFNPQAKNRLSSARGLIQFTDETAVSLGYKDSSDLVKKAPTIIDQLPIVERYLLQYAPFPTRQSLFMSVFYPPARNWLPYTSFPQFVIDANPGIVTVYDYMKKASKGGVSTAINAIPFILGASIVVYFYMRRKGIL